MNVIITILLPSVAWFYFHNAFLECAPQTINKTEINTVIDCEKPGIFCALDNDYTNIANVGKVHLVLEVEQPEQLDDKLKCIDAVTKKVVREL